ncbi:hypothetical protein HJG60_011774 [Phyllostomus discolor]|uniref:Uncharacterized protein n=1 Tax=Phyllostomus discolor TaxID=89673 RepID=A0A833ZLA8_9CHIR|nr:hypothetical protein HJG60_011774 [Phyllostomus discolor]
MGCSPLLGLSWTPGSCSSGKTHPRDPSWTAWPWSLLPGRETSWPPWGGLWGGAGPSPAPWVRLCLPPCGQPPCKGLWKAPSLGNIRQCFPVELSRAMNYFMPVLSNTVSRAAGHWAPEALLGAGPSSRRPPGRHLCWTRVGPSLFGYLVG